MLTCGNGGDIDRHQDGLEPRRLSCPWQVKSGAACGADRDRHSNRPRVVRPRQPESTVVDMASRYCVAALLTSTPRLVAHWSARCKSRCCPTFMPTSKRCTPVCSTRANGA